MSARPLLRTAAFVAFVVVLAACGRSQSITAYEPGVYKGAKDPLLDLQSTAEHKAALKERFTRGQVDR